MLRICLKNVFGFAEHQENGIYALGYFDSQKGHIDHDVENREGGVDAKIDTIDCGRYVPPYRAGTLDYVKQRKNKTSRVPTELKHIKICYCKTYTNYFVLHLGVGNGSNISIHVPLKIQK